MLDFVHRDDLPPLPSDPEFSARAQVNDLMTRPKGERAAELRTAMQDVMMDKVSVAREGTGLNEAKEVMDGIRRAYNHVSIDDHSTNYNTDLTEALELGCMIDCAEAIIEGAILRTESRGAHYREDFPNRDDANWLAHSLVYKTSGGLELAKKPVTITIFEPKERKY
jgi:succinate dehydrogenase / fumarate reductase flavoprotein subunit